MFSYKQLDAYRGAIELLALATELNAELPDGFAGLSDQLTRASLSVPLNIAEGVGRLTLADKRRDYLRARGSAIACGAIIDALIVLRVVDDDKAQRGEQLVVQLVGMLSQLTQRP